MNTDTLRHTIGFYALLFGATALMAYTAFPYIHLLLMAFIIAVATSGLYSWILGICGNKTMLASALSVGILLVLVGAPLSLFVVIASDQATTLIPEVQRFFEAHPFASFAQDMPLVSAWFPNFDLGQSIQQGMSELANYMKGLLVPFATATLYTTLNLILFIFMMLFMYPVKDTIVQYATELLPLGDRDAGNLVAGVIEAARTTLQSTFLAAFVQALASIVAFVVLGVTAPVFWFFAVFLVSLLPLGSGLVNIPIAAALYFTGHPWSAIALLMWQVLIVSQVDNIIRIFMMRRTTTQLPPLLTLVATLGGIAAFGFLGIIYGPIIAVIFVFMVELYRSKQHSLSLSK